MMSFGEGTGLLFFSGMGNGARFYAPPYWKIDALKNRAGKNPYYQPQPDGGA